MVDTSDLSTPTDSKNAPPLSSPLLGLGDGAGPTTKPTLQTAAAAAAASKRPTATPLPDYHMRHAITTTHPPSLSATTATTTSLERETHERLFGLVWLVFPCSLSLLPSSPSTLAPSMTMHGPFRVFLAPHPWVSFTPHHGAAAAASQQREHQEAAAARNFPPHLHLPLLLYFYIVFFFLLPCLFLSPSTSLSPWLSWSPALAGRLLVSSRVR